MPWRATKNPYYIWISEIILQQTRVEQGTAYYFRFLRLFPKIEDLAFSSEQNVLNAWQGLGYYSRARNLHATARAIVMEKGGKFPSTYNELIRLKGVGPYTAAAISSIAFGEPQPAIDGNVIRVLSRLFEIDKNAQSAAGKRELNAAALALMDTTDPGIHNQAMMELGSLVCTPRNPQCSVCPVSLKCGSFHKGTQMDFPPAKKKTTVRERFFQYFIRTDGEYIVVRHRKAGDIWEGLYDFPMKETTKEADAGKAKLDLRLTHLLSHQKLKVSFWIDFGKKHRLAQGEKKILLSQIDQYPMPQLLIIYLRQSRYFSGKSLPLGDQKSTDVIERKQGTTHRKSRARS